MSVWNRRRVFACSWPEAHIHELLIPMRQSIATDHRWPQTMLEQLGVCRDYIADDIVWHFLRENIRLLPAIPAWVLALLDGDESSRLYPPFRDDKKINYVFQFAHPDAEPAIWTAIRIASLSMCEQTDGETVRVVVYVHEWPDHQTRQSEFAAGAMTNQAADRRWVYRLMAS